MSNAAKQRSRKPRESAPPKSTRRRKIDRSAAEQLVEEFKPLVRRIACGFQRKLPRHVLAEDLVAAGMGGLWDAVLKHGDQAKAPTFEWYVRVRVRGAILDELRTQDWLPRRARTNGAQAPAVVRIDDISSLEQSRCLTASDAYDVEASVEASLARHSLRAAVEKLPDRERKIVSLHYFRGMKFKDLGAMLGVSEPRISQLHARAVGRLRGLLDDAA